MASTRIPLVGFVAYSGTGKTTLLLKIIPLLKEKGLHLGIIKHSHHAFEIDYPGKDSYRLRQAGAKQLLIASRQRRALIMEDNRSEEVYLDQCLPFLEDTQLDLILVEGFKHERFPKIEVHRPSLGRPLMFPEDDSIIAIACDAPFILTTSLPILDMNNPEEIIEFIEENILRGDSFTMKREFF